MEDEDLFYESMDWAEAEAKKIKHAFLTKQPIKVTLSFNEGTIKDFLKAKGYSHPTKGVYGHVLRMFLKWLRER